MDFTQGDLKSAFRRLAKRDVVQLTKPDDRRRDAFEYSGNDRDDEEFFFRGPFNVTITDEGRSRWDSIRAAKPASQIGFVHQ